MIYRFQIIKIIHHIEHEICQWISPFWIILLSSLTKLIVPLTYYKTFHYSTAPLSISVSYHYCAQNVAPTLCNWDVNTNPRTCFSPKVTNEKLRRLRTQCSSNFVIILLNLKKDKVKKLVKLEFHIPLIVISNL
jgi:hypothetical protein